MIWMNQFSAKKLCKPGKKLKLGMLISVASPPKFGGRLNKNWGLQLPNRPLMPTRWSREKHWCPTVVAPNEHIVENWFSFAGPAQKLPGHKPGLPHFTSALLRSSGAAGFDGWTYTDRSQNSPNIFNAPGWWTFSALDWNQACLWTRHSAARSSGPNLGLESPWVPKENGRRQ